MVCWSAFGSPSLLWIDIYTPPNTNFGLWALQVAKYRPACPVLVVSDEDHVLRLASVRFGLYPYKLSSPEPDLDSAIQEVIQYTK